ncbi:MAG: NAD(P)H-binding protein [Archangium sp.]
MTASLFSGLRAPLAASPVRHKVLVTCAAGHVGREVVQQLVSRGAGVVAGDRAAGRTAGLFGAEVEHVLFDFRERMTWPDAVRKTRVVFLVRPPALFDVAGTVVPFIDFALANGVEHIVLLSLAGAEHTAHVPHRLIESHLQRRTAKFTVLRSAFFVQNLVRCFRADLVERGCLYVPSEERRVNWVDAREVAEVAANVLLAPATHRGRVYELAGPGRESWDEVLDVLSLALRRPVRVEAVPVFGYVSQLMQRGMTAGEATRLTVLHFILRTAAARVEDRHMTQLLGRSPLSVDAYVREHASGWSSSA